MSPVLDQIRFFDVMSKHSMDFFADIVHKALELRKESGETKVKFMETSLKRAFTDWDGWGVCHYNLMEISLYKQHTQAGRVCLLWGVNHAQHRMNETLGIGSCFQGDTNHGSACDVLARRTSRLEYVLFVKGIFNDHKYMFAF